MKRILGMIGAICLIILFIIAQPILWLIMREFIKKYPKGDFYE